MKSKKDSKFVIAFILLVFLFLFFGGGAMTSGMMNDGVRGSGWMGDRGWMWTPTLITLCLGIGIGWMVFRKQD